MCSVPDGWVVKTLGEVCEFKRGLTYKKSNEVNFSNNAVLRANNIILETGLLSFDEIKYIDNNIKIPKEKIVKKGSLLICTASGSKKHLGKSALIDKEYNYAFGGFLGMLTPNKEINSKFLYWQTRSKKYTHFILSLTDGISINNLRFNQLSEFTMLIPPLAEQKRIVSILDKAFTEITKAKANAEQNLKNTKELFKNYLQGVFENKGDDWVEKKLGEVCAYDKQKNEKSLPYIGLEHIEAHTGRFLGNKQPLEVKSSTFSFTENHLLYGRLRPYLNKVLLPDFEGHCSSEIFPIKTNELIMREFLYYWFISSKTVKKIDATWTGTRMPRANMKEVINFRIVIPSIKEQKHIVKKLDTLQNQTKKLEAIYQQKIAILDELKKSALQKAFKGEL